jgi:hypothetical protein
MRSSSNCPHDLVARRIFCHGPAVPDGSAGLLLHLVAEEQLVRRREGRLGAARRVGERDDHSLRDISLGKAKAVLAFLEL